MPTGEVWRSDALLRLLGEEQAASSIGLDAFFELVHAEDLARVRELLEASVESHSRVDVDFRLRTTHRGVRWFHASASTHAGESGVVEFLSGELRDITDERTAEEQHRQTERQLHQQERMDALDCLAGGIAHEFNNVLQAVRGYIAFAMDELSPESQAFEDLEQALSASERAATLTRSLLDFARADEQVSERYDIRDVLQGLDDLLRPVIGEDVALRTNAQGVSMICEADSQGLRQSLLNLCINARDAMPQGGELLVTAAPFFVDEVTSLAIHGLAEGRYCRVCVTDNGAGIPAEIVAKVFDPFFSTKEIGRGTGLGLATVYGFVQRSGGKVSVHSEPGVGTTFSIYLPIEEVHDMSNIPGCPDLQADQPSTVLLVEDDPQVREVGLRSLLKAGYQVLTAADGESGLETYIDNVDDIDLVVLDVVLPKLSGRRVFEEMRQLQSEVPVIFTTGFDPISAIGANGGQLADSTLAKPYDRRQLLAEVKTLLALRSPAGAATA